MSVNGVNIAGATFSASIGLIAGAMGYCALKNPIDPRDGAPELTNGPRRTIFLAFSGFVLSGAFFCLDMSRVNKN